MAKPKKRARGVYLSDLLRCIGACPESIAFARSRRGKRGGLRATYRAAEGNWLHWLSGRLHLGLVDDDAALWAYRMASYGSPAERRAAQALYPYPVVLTALRKAAREARS